MANAIGPGAHVSSRKRNKQIKHNDADYDQIVEDDYDEDFIPAKRSRGPKPKPLQNINSYDSIQHEVTMQKQRNTPARKPKTSRSVKREEMDDVEDPEITMSTRMVDKIAALNDGRRTKVVMANCFEGRTALDCIDLCIQESENMQEDAVALAIATNVYSLRVDRTHNDAQETRYTFIRGKSDAEKAMLLATEENVENTKDKRRRKKAERDAEGKKDAEPDVDNIHIENNSQQEWLKTSESNSFDYTFGLKFPAGGPFFQHWSFIQELLEKIEIRRLDVRRNKRRRKLTPWRKVPALDFCTIYTDFMHVTRSLESDHIDALATFQARRDITGKIILLHEAMVRKPVPPTTYVEEVELDVLKSCQDMLANPWRKTPMVWEHYLLEDNPGLYRTGQYLRTGDMTGYVLQERPFYHHFDPDKETADDPRENENYVEKNADRTLYTFKKQPKGTSLSRRAPLIRVPVNKYANPRNRKIDDLYFKEDIGHMFADEEIDVVALESTVEEVYKQFKEEHLTSNDAFIMCKPSGREQSVQVEEMDDDDDDTEDSDVSLLDRLRSKHQKNIPAFDLFQKDLTKQAKERCNKIVKECHEAKANLRNAADSNEVDDEDLKEWKTSLFLDNISPLRDVSFEETLHDVFVRALCGYDVGVPSKEKQVASILGSGRDAIEWRVPEETIFKDISDLIARGVHNDIRQMDATYHMKVFKFRVTVEQAHESLRRVERIGAGRTPEDLAILKQKCFRPGRYNGICDSGEVSKYYRIDPWATHSSTLTFAEQYFRCCNYPKLEGSLLRLRNDIHESTKKIAKDSWYYASNNDNEDEIDCADWKDRLHEVVLLFNSRMGKNEEKLLREHRALPRIARRSLGHGSQFAISQKVSPTTGESVAPPEDAIQMDMDDPGGGDDFIFPSDDVCANVEEEVLSINSRPVESVADSADRKQEVVPPESATRKGRNKADNADTSVTKKGRRIKTEVEIKTEPPDDYFVKMEVHSPFTLKSRFAIGTSRTTTRGEDDTFGRKPVPRRSRLGSYQAGTFITPGLLQKGSYPGVKLEVKESVDGPEPHFTGSLGRSPTTEEPPAPPPPVTPDTENGVCDEWLTSFGGCRAIPEDQCQSDKPSEEQSDVPAPVQDDPTFENGGDTMNDTMNDTMGSFDDPVFYPGSSKKDRFKDIRPDEFKAIGIDVKNIVPKKDFYAMTKEERAAAVAAEFEAIDALGPKKEEGYVISIMDFSCRVIPYHLNTAKMKKVMKSILSNPLLAYDKVLYSRRALLARRRADQRHKNESIGPEVYFKKLDRSLDVSLGPIAHKILEEHNPLDITAIDPIDVLDAVNYRNLDDMVDDDDSSSKRGDAPSAGVEESMRQFAAEVRQADFKVQGLHTFSSVMRCLPRRMGSLGKYVNVANALAVTLYMCNENTLTLVQERNDGVDKNASLDEVEPWMANFIITNAVDVPSLLGELNIVIACSVGWL
ncbi:hypothetical protein Q1695_006030 [Nippostrongylus brasiliensis]|nr:hypothetical protein Q1695_006030 [Nippostrongylus brasiliensis]